MEGNIGRGGLDGMPLASKLAAARTASISGLKGLASRLDDRLQADENRGRRHGVAAAGQTLRATLQDWKLTRLLSRMGKTRGPAPGPGCLSTAGFLTLGGQASTGGRPSAEIRRHRGVGYDHVPESGGKNSPRRCGWHPGRDGITRAARGTMRAYRRLDKGLPKPGELETGGAQPCRITTGFC